MNNHKQRLKARKSRTSPKKRKSSFGKIFLICFLAILFLLLIFNIVFVKREEIITNITVTNKVLVSEGGENTYYSFSKTGTHTRTLKYSPVYKIFAISEKDGEIEFYQTNYNSFLLNTKYYVEYTKITILNKTKIKNIKIKEASLLKK